MLNLMAPPAVRASGRQQFQQAQAVLRLSLAAMRLRGGVPVMSAVMVVATTPPPSRQMMVLMVPPPHSPPLLTRLMVVRAIMEGQQAPALTAAVKPGAMSQRGALCHSLSALWTAAPCHRPCLLLLPHKVSSSRFVRPTCCRLRRAG